MKTFLDILAIVIQVVVFGGIAVGALWMLINLIIIVPMVGVFFAGFAAFLWAVTREISI